MPLSKIDVQAFVDTLDVSLPPLEDFWRLGDLTALRAGDDGKYVRSNYERGILLYALVGHYRPQHILEFGTGRGYGSLCMAWSMVDHKINGQVMTIDAVPSNKAISWAIDWQDGKGGSVQTLSRDDVWPKALDANYLQHIEQLHGDTAEILSQYQGPKIDLAFIDAGHFLKAARHDFYSTLSISAPKFGVLFDDYNPRFGVKQLIDEDVIPNFDASMINTDRTWAGGERAGMESDYGMIWIHSDSLSRPLNEAFDFAAINKFLKSYRTVSKNPPRWRVWAHNSLKKIGLR